MGGVVIRIEIPGQPIAKGRPRVVVRNGHAHAYTPERTVSYENRIAAAGADAMGSRPPLEGPLAVTAFAFFQLPKAASKKRRELAATGADWHTVKPDGDNCLKVLDSLNGIVWRDDSQICKAEIVKLYSERPRFVIEVRPILIGAQQ